MASGEKGRVATTETAANLRTRNPDMAAGISCFFYFLVLFLFFYFLPCSLFAFSRASFLPRRTRVHTHTHLYIYSVLSIYFQLSSISAALGKKAHRSFTQRAYAARSRSLSDKPIPVFQLLTDVEFIISVFFFCARARKLLVYIMLYRKRAASIISGA